MKIAFMGTPDFAVPALTRLIESEHEVVLVVTQPSRPKGRGRKVVDPPVKTLADASGIPVLQPETLKAPVPGVGALEDRIRELGVDVIVVVAFGMLLPQSLLDAPRLGVLNIHGSLLPAWRGAAPVQRCLMDGGTETGVTIMKMVLKLDAGPMIAQERVEIHEDDDARSVTDLLSVLGADLLIRVLADIGESGEIEGVEQDESLATYAAKITRADGVMDWSLTSERIMFNLRAVTPWPGAWTSWDGRRMKIVQAEPLAESEAEHHGATLTLKAGTICGLMPGFGFIVATGGGPLLVTRLQLEGRPETDAAAFLRGHKVEVGQKLG